MIIKVHNGRSQVMIHPSMFNGGEINLKLEEEGFFHTENLMMISLTLKDSDAFMALVMVVDAIRRTNPLAKLGLATGYFPYARQDRVCNIGEALSVKAFATQLNTLKLDCVLVADPHSDVVGAVVDNCFPISQVEIIKAQDEFYDWLVNTKPLIVSPDAGANKKTQELCKVLGRPSFIRADKARDMATGKITETIVYENYEGELDGKHVVIVDDIADGSFTFTQLAKVLKAKGVDTVSLYVTHGIFSKGVQTVIDNGIDHIYTTDSYHGLNYFNHPQVTVETCLHR